MAGKKEQPVNWRTFMICVFISVGQFVSAYSSVIIGTTLGKRDFMQVVSLWNAEGEPLPGANAKVGAVVGLFQTGAVFGCILAAFIMDKWGRKAGLIMGSVISLIGFAGQTGTMNLGMFIAFRFITGVGAWAYGTVCSLYIAELAPPQYRGFFVGLNGVMIGGGCAVASYIGMGLFFASNPVLQWRIPLAIPLVLIIAIMCYTPFIPESPRYLLLKGDREKAWKIVEKLHFVKDDPEQVYATAEFFQMTKQAEHDNLLDQSWIGLLKKPSYRKRLIIGAALTFFGQSTAVTVISNYGQVFYKSLGMDAAKQQLLQGNRDIIALIGNIVGSLLVDRIGRRMILILGFTGCLACLIIEAIVVKLYGGTMNIAGQNAGIAFIYIYLIFYSLGIDVGTFIFVGEMFPNHIRAKGLAISLASLNATNTIYLSITSIAFTALGWKFFLIFISLSACGIVFVFLCIPETSGLPLEEVGTLFGDSEDVMVYMKNIHLDPSTHKLIVDKEPGVGGSQGISQHIETSNA